jgi:CrcB protein
MEQSMIAMYVALAGSLGAICRFIIDGYIRAVLNTTFPWATLCINVSGSFILGIVTGVALHTPGATILVAIVGAGFCGGYTTFSTASFETVRLLEQRNYVAAFVNAAGTAGITLVTASAGIAIGLLF